MRLLREQNCRKLTVSQTDTLAALCTTFHLLNHVPVSFCSSFGFISALPSQTREHLPNSCPRNTFLQFDALAVV
jgi:hypothetical protein